MENKPVEITNESNQKTLPLLKVLLKKSPLIILVIVLCALISFGYAVIKTKPSYTASCSVIFRMEVKYNPNDLSSGQYNQATLTKLYLPSVSNIVKTDAIMTLSSAHLDDTIAELERVESYLETQLGRTPNAQEIASEMNLSLGQVNNLKKIIGQEMDIKFNPGSVNMSYSDKSLIFTLAYTDVSPELASGKLDALIETVAKDLYIYVQASNVTLVSMQNENNIEMSFNRSKFVVLGGGVGAVVSITLVLVLYILDNTLKSKEELEQITGVDVLGVIEK